MAGAVSRLADAAARGDSSETQEASAELREALAEFESGLAAHRALAEGQVQVRSHADEDRRLHLC